MLFKPDYEETDARLDCPESAAAEPTGGLRSEGTSSPAQRTACRECQEPGGAACAEDGYSGGFSALMAGADSHTIKEDEDQWIISITGKMADWVSSPVT